jgi:hypothetical protein
LSIANFGTMFPSSQRISPRLEQHMADKLYYPPVPALIRTCSGATRLMAARFSPRRHTCGIAAGRSSARAADSRTSSAASRRREELHKGRTRRIRRECRYARND